MVARGWVWEERERDSATGLDTSENRRESGEMGYMWFMVKILVVREHLGRWMVGGHVTESEWIPDAEIQSLIVYDMFQFMISFSRSLFRIIVGEIRGNWPNSKPALTYSAFLGPV